MSQRRPSRAAPTGEHGNVLLTTLLIVAVMAALAVSLMGDIHFAMRKARNVEARAQALYYAVGAEQLAMQMIGRALKVSPDRVVEQGWLVEPVTFPIEGGFITARIQDAANCFNLNALVKTDGGREREPDPAALLYYQRLLVALDLDDGTAEFLANAAADWLDADSRPLPRGAEDFDYIARDIPHLAANSLMSDVSELRGVAGYTLSVYERIRPFVCVHPSTKMSPLNVNTLREEHAPLLVMLYGIEQLSFGAAQSVLAARPASGYASPDEFWAQQGLAGKNPGEAERALVSLKTGYYSLAVEVAYGEAVVEQASLLAVNKGTGLKVVSRRDGVAE